MQIVQHIQAEAAALRQQGAEKLSAAQAEVAALEQRAQALEAKIEGLPAELAALTEDAGARAWEWIKRLF